MVEKNNITAMKLSFNFFKGNYALSFGALAILVVLLIFSAIPILGIIFAIFYSILSISIQIYFGKSVNEIETIDEITTKASETKIADFLTKYLSIASGGFLGLFFVALLLFFIFFIISIPFGVINMQSFSNMNSNQLMFEMATQYSIPSIIILLIIGFLLYIFPAVFGKIIFSENFNEAFKNSFLLLNPKFWKKSFNKEYFILILIWSIIVTFVYIFSIFLSSTFILLPVALLLLYLLSLYNAAIYVFAKELLIDEK